MKRIITVAILLAAMAAVPAGAAPKWLTAVPRAVGRTYGNMFTFKHPVLALEQWASVGAVTLDLKTSMDAWARCPTCSEAGSIFHGQRFGLGHAIPAVAVLGTFYGTSEQVGDELLRNDPNKFWRNINNSLVAIPVGFHVQAAVHNIDVGK